MISNPLLEFFYSVNPTTSEIRTKNKKGQKITPCQTAWYKDIRFRVFDTGLVVIEGSLHKYWNNGEHNFNDFDLKSVKIVLIEFLKTFKINPGDAIITQLEIGLNIQIDYPIDQVLENVFFHRKTPFKWTYTKTEGNYYQVEHQLYRIKIYDKSLQYKKHFLIDQELLRVEINFQGVQLRNSFGVSTISDLMSIPFSDFSETIKKEIASILFFDFTINHSSQLIYKYANRNEWKKYIDRNQSSSFEKHKRKLKWFILNHSENVLNHIVETIDEKSNELTFGGMSINDICIDINTVPLDQYQNIPEHPKKEDRTCIVTGFGISMQRRNSKFLSIAGLRFYKTFNYKVFQSLEQRFLTHKWDHSSEEERIKELYHNIRNKYNNNKHKINPNQLNLF